MKDIMGIMKQAQAMQQRMQEMQTEFERTEVTGQAGGGLVSVTLTAKGAMKGVVSTIIEIVSIKQPKTR